MTFTWLKYGGHAWMPEIGRTVWIPWAVYPVVDLQDDNLGRGIIVRTGGLDALIDEGDLGKARVEIGVRR